MYSEDDWNLLGSTLDENYMPTPETEQLQKELISQRLHVSPAQLGKLFLTRFVIYGLPVVWYGFPPR